MATSYGVKEKDEVKTRELPSKEKSFREAFAKARDDMKKGGPDTFTWRGKTYSTALKSPSKTPVKGRTAGMKGTAFSEEPVSVKASRVAGISEDMPSKRSGGGMDDDRRVGTKSSGGMKERLSKAGLMPSEDLSLGKSLLAAMGMAGGPSARTVGSAGAKALSELGAARAIGKAGSSKASETKAAMEFGKGKAAQVSSDTGRRFTAKQEMEAATSSVKGAAARKEMAKKRAERAQMMEKSKKDVLKGTASSKKKPRDRTREKEDTEFRKGGMAKKR